MQAETLNLFLSFLENHYKAIKAYLCFYDGSYNQAISLFFKSPLINI